jgi:hypothetical protein
MTRRPVGAVALTRSGDKGADANVGVWTRSARAYELLRAALSEEVVGRHFAAICSRPVRRYELPNLLALNFVLPGALGEGGSTSLRSDAQGKVLGLALARLEIDLPDDLDLITGTEPDRCGDGEPGR